MSDTSTQQILTILQLLEQNRAGEALAEIQVLLARSPDHGKAQALYGHILMTYLKDYAAAEEAFRIAMRQAPTYVDLYYSYGELLIILDKGTETVAVLNKALEVPGIAKNKIYQLFGQLYERQSAWNDAVEYYTKAIFYSLNDLEVAQYQAAITRVKGKMGL